MPKRNRDNKFDDGKFSQENKRRKLIENVALVPTQDCSGKDISVLAKFLKKNPGIRSTVNNTFFVAFNPQSGSPEKKGKSPGDRIYRKSQSRLTLSSTRLKLRFFNLLADKIKRTNEKPKQISALSDPFYNKAQKIIYMSINRSKLIKAANKSRLNADRIMGTSATNYAITFGYEEQPNNKFHWGHGAAHMFGDIDGISPENRDNLVVITNECNMQMLQYETMIRKYINDRQVQQAKLKITINLLQSQTGEYIHIADSIHYNFHLDKEYFKNVFHGLQVRTARESRRVSTAVINHMLFGENKENLTRPNLDMGH